MFSSINQTDNKNFYPTPLYLIKKMEDKVKNWNIIQNVLEPSAGKGDIVDFLNQRNKYKYNENDKISIDCIEIDDNLRHILTGNGHRVVHDDFLTYKGYKNYELIMMNPPFDCGDKHLLKAIDLQKDGGEIVCLLNAETLLNTCTNTRKDLVRKLTELDAEIEFVKNAFEKAERKTKVETAIVHILIKPNKNQYKSFIAEDLKRAKHIENDNYEATQITDKIDFLSQIVEQYEFEAEGGLRLIKEYEAFQPYINKEFEQKDEEGETVNYGYSRSLLQLNVLGCNDRFVDPNKYIELLRYKYWKALFGNREFTKNLTSNLVKKYYTNIENMMHYDFSMYNIKAIQLEMSKNIIQGIEDTILSLFEEFSSKHYYDEMSNNIHYYNGWKTNKCYIINKKVIIPLSGYYDIEYSWGRYNPSSFDVVNKLDDIQKVFDYLDGGITLNMNLKHELKQAEINGVSKKIQLKYFMVTFYKKGTCHIEFTNADLLKKFNIFGSQKKGWLPPSYGKKNYSEMNEEEKKVIDSFEGEKEYNKVMTKKDYFIVDRPELLLLN